MLADPPESNNARLGMVFFLAYLVLYGGFVGLNAFAPAAMERPALAGVNLAIVYGVGLIVAAFALALLYAALCPKPTPQKDDGR